jgi:hypothetical protein
MKDNPLFTGPKCAYVGRSYGAPRLPRLVFVSLDSGKGDPDAANHTCLAIQGDLENAAIEDIPKGKHWRETLELARLILSRYDQAISLDTVVKYFSHTNSAKCCQNKDDNAEADGKLFKNCNEYLNGELKVLCPHIIITQGGWAHWSIKKCFHIRCKMQMLQCPQRIVPVSWGKVLWLSTYHPGYYKGFPKQRESCWNHFADAAVDFFPRW